MAAKKSTTNELGEAMTNYNDRKKMADLIVSQINTSFGKGSIMKMNEVADGDVDAISTGSLSVDLAVGIGGFPKGRIIEIYGPESSGKTSLALSTVAQSQKKGGICAFVDAEHALDPARAKQFGVRVDDLYISQPNNGEEALEIVDNLVRSNAFDVIVIDSVAALVPKSEIEGNMGDSQMGVQARLMSQALRKLTGVISKSSTVVIFINQIRLKIGVMFGSPETTTGGQALKFYASMRLDIRKIGALKNGTEDVGQRVKVKIVKNKMAAPFKIVEFDMMFSEPGVFSLSGELVDMGPAYGVVTKTGNTYSLEVEGQESVKLGVGREQARKYFLENPLVADKTKDKIIAIHKERVKLGQAEMESNTQEREDDDFEADEE